MPQLFVSIPYSVIMFGTFQSLRPQLRSESCAGDLGGCFLAGAASGVAVTAVHNPLELWRVRVQTHLPLQNGSDRGRPRTNRAVLRGLAARPWQLGRGASMTLAENVVGNGVFFSSHEALRRAAWSDESWAAEVLIGGLTGLIFQLAVYPADLIKARLMTAHDGGSAVAVARQLLRTGGLAGFYRGASVAVLRAFAINAAGWPALRAAQCYLGVAPPATR